jgi:hypothetical protein
MKKFFTLISMALVAMSVNAQDEESYEAAPKGALSAAYAAVVDADGKTAKNVENGNSIVKFGTANVEVEAVGSGEPANVAGTGAEQITVGNVISAEEHTYELISIDATQPVTWEVANQGDINFCYVKGKGKPAVSMVAEEIVTEGEGTGTYKVKYTAFDPAVGGEPISGLYYKFTTKVDGALKVGIWANKGSHSTFLVDSETKQPSEYLVEGYINGQNDAAGKKKWLSNDEIRALGNPEKPWVIGAGNQPFWGNVVIDAKAGKTYWVFQGTTQIGFQGYVFYPGKKKEDVPTGIESVKTVAAKSVGAPIYNLAGQKVNSSYKGIAIQNGKKFMVK